jgi:hypothetical protein
MDVARLSHLQLERLPQLIQLEREIDAEMLESEDVEDVEEETEEEFQPPQRVRPPVRNPKTPLFSTVLFV